MTPEDKFF